VIRRIALLVEDRHHLVAHDLVDLAAVRLEQRHDGLEVGVQHRRDVNRLALFAVCGEAGEIG
jgi:hypothetical protein